MHSWLSLGNADIRCLTLAAEQAPLADDLSDVWQALVLVPEIGLTPQTLARFRARLPVPVHVLHSNLSDGDRAQAWTAMAEGIGRVLLGTRSAVFTPMPEAGLVIVDEEHDSSYKQQDGFHYHARDVAVLRAKSLDVPVLLGSATPSLESWHNADIGRYQRHRLPERAGAAIAQGEQALGAVATHAGEDHARGRPVQLGHGFEEHID